MSPGKMFSERGNPFCLRNRYKIVTHRNDC